MTPDLSPGDLVRTCPCGFILFHSIKLFPGGSWEGVKADVINIEFDNNGALIGLVIASPLGIEERGDCHIVYVLLPKRIGWTRRFNLEENVT